MDQSTFTLHAALYRSAVCALTLGSVLAFKIPVNLTQRLKYGPGTVDGSGAGIWCSQNQKAQKFKTATSEHLAVGQTTWTGKCSHCQLVDTTKDGTNKGVLQSKKQLLAEPSKIFQHEAATSSQKKTTPMAEKPWVNNESKITIFRLVKPGYRIDSRE
ncbi:hypothetical protein B0H16DRAFT_1456044 [Mycena metata]|uniref:Uncharacterized protein n=1 Tax=Mycena metata TaxID=1033252 RepID=A0AAD7NI19_9AGAR|nr:hypothetical protein B0H16DRAFT_1456044 [Mycena metata]